MDLEACVSKLETYVRYQAYSGYSKFDALNSPLLEKLFGRTYLGRLLVTQIVNRVPLPLRSLFLVQPSRNPKGIANFIKGYCLMNASGQDQRNTISSLADWLIIHDSNHHGQFSGPGTAWGYNFPWQSPGFFAPRHSPNLIVTVFCAEALLEAYRTLEDERYLQAARGSAQFILEALPVLEEDEQKKCIGYVQHGLSWKVININAVAAGFLSRLHAFDQNSEYLSQAGKMIRWVESVQQQDHSWNYTEPRSQSGIGPDNYHTGGILDGLLDYVEVSGDQRVRRVWRNGMEYYRKEFFEENGAPKWRADRSYPQDIHGAAQGIISFSRGAALEPEYLDQAKLILSWTLKNLRAPHGGFYYQKRRLFTWKLELMRWNNSWMFWAMGEHLRSLAAAVSARRTGT